MSKNKRILCALTDCVVAMVAVMVGLIGMADAAWVKVTPAEFTDDGRSGPGGYYKFAKPGSLQGTAAFPCLVAAVKIPESATRINKLTVYLIDASTGLVNKPYLRLIGTNMTTGVSTTYADTPVVTGTSELQAIEVPLTMLTRVKGQNFALTVCLDDAQAILGAKVNYQ